MEFGDFDIFAAKDEVAQQGRVLTLDPEQVYADPDNVRRAIDQDEIDALAETIRARGQFQPIIVAPPGDDGRYMIQFGERRWLACRQLGRHVRAIVREVCNPAQVRIDQFIENDQREQLSVRDMIAFVAGQVAAGMSIADLARATGRDRARLSRLHSLAFAPDFIAARLEDLPVRGAMALMKAAGRDELVVRQFLDAAPVGSLSVSDFEALARGLPVQPGRGGEGDRLASVPVRAEPIGSTAVGQQGARAAPARRGDGTRFIDIEGRRGRLIEALVHFEGEDQARTVRFDS
jgi:ParB family chromosome partitioning protein